MTHSTSKAGLYNAGLKLVRAFCALNGVPVPGCTVVAKAHWFVSACAFYRPDTPPEGEHRLDHHGPGINICLEECQHPAGEAMSRNWSWPGNTVDRTPYGVVCHEFGHHLDWWAGEKKGKYYSELSGVVKTEANEPGLTTYADTNPAEWFAEAVRLYLTNGNLLAHVRPATYKALTVRWKPLPQLWWYETLGTNCPKRVVSAARRKTEGGK